MNPQSPRSTKSTPRKRTGQQSLAPGMSLPRRSYIPLLILLFSLEKPYDCANLHPNIGPLGEWARDPQSRPALQNVNLDELEAPNALESQESACSCRYLVSVASHPSRTGYPPFPRLQPVLFLFAQWLCAQGADPDEIAARLFQDPNYASRPMHPPFPPNHHQSRRWLQNLGIRKGAIIFSPSWMWQLKV